MSVTTNPGKPMPKVKTALAVEADINTFADRDREGLPHGLTVVDPVKMNTAPEPGTWAYDLATALVDIRKALAATSNADREPLFVGIDQVFVREYPATQWLIAGLIVRGGIAMLGAEPKSGKTWLATELAVAVATGTHACGEFAATQGRAAYFFAEDLAIQVRNRVRALCAARGVDPMTLDNLFVCPRGKFLDVTRDEDLAWLVASCRKLAKLDLVVLDPLRDISSAAEDKSDEMSPVMRRLRLLGELVGCTVAVAHHAGKPTTDTAKRRPGQRMRGSSAIYGSTDSGIYFGIRGGDGTSRFGLEVDAEVKGARSAGHFELELAVEDDAEGAAVRATWTVSRLGDKKAGSSAHEPDDAKAFEFVRMLAARGEHLAKSALRDHDEHTIPDKRMRGALERLLDSGRLVLRGAKVHMKDSPRPFGEVD